MSHRTQITLTDAQYERLRRESQLSGLGLAELVRRALDSGPEVRSRADVLHRLERSFGGWSRRDYDGAKYVEGMRRGMGRRLRS